MGGFTAEIKVGLLVLAGLIAVVYMSFQVGRPDPTERDGYELVAFFDTVSGLKPGTPVEMAGIRIGSVEGIGLHEGRAEVVLRIRPDVLIAHDAQAVIRTRGVLGDRFVQIVPGSPQEPALTPGSEIDQTQSQVDVDELLVQLTAIAEDVKSVTASLKGAVGGVEGEEALREIVENTRRVTGSLDAMVTRNTEIFEQILSNFRSFSADLKELSGVNKENVHVLIANVRDASESLEETLTGLQSIVRRVEQGEGTLGRLLVEDETIEELNAALASVRDVSDRIRRGEGTLGKLVTDPSIGEKLDETLTHVSSLTARAERLRVYLGYRGEYLVRGDDVKSYVNLRIQPSLDKYYLLSVVDDPRGRMRSKVTDLTVTHPDGSTTFERVSEQQIDEDELKFSAQIAKRYFDTTIRGGIIESTGGFGVDHYLFDDNLKLSAEVFDFDSSRKPHVKFYADANLFDHFYVTAGYDDAFSDRGRKSFFVGAGLQFKDDDLKFLLGGTNISLP